MSGNNGLLYSSNHGYIKYLEDLLNDLLKNGLKISSKKHHLFRTELQYIT